MRMARMEEPMERLRGILGLSNACPTLEVLSPIRLVAVLIEATVPAPDDGDTMV